jgi:hypothetical protein
VIEGEELHQLLSQVHYQGKETVKGWFQGWFTDTHQIVWGVRRISPPLPT